jgi:hypothetical protein
MERHIVDHPRGGSNLRLPRYVEHERETRIRGPHHAVNVLRRLPRGSGSVNRVKSYLRIERASEGA